ncbi:MAG: secretion system protein E [Candidatus Aenigmarchaeota archaeon ex4484_56]|nr:MAG: secretion system protein E [Candidatus Aenigmarchaeota archaeon ex4484_56]
MFKIEEEYQYPDSPKKLINKTYYLIKPFAKVKICSKNNEIIYKIIEPKLTKEEKEILDEITEDILQTLDKSPNEIENKEELIKYLYSIGTEILSKRNIKLSDRSFNKLMYYVYRDFVGLNEIEPLMHDDYIEDINCNGLNVPVFIRHRLLGNTPTNLIYRDRQKLKNFIIKLAQRCNKYITYSEPFLEGSLKDGSRIQGTISEEISPNGPNFSIRKFQKIPYSPTELIKMNSISSDSLAYLWYLIEKGLNILIIGGAGSGKTTLLNAISAFIPEKAKIVSIEDTREIKLYHENWIATVSRESIGGLEIGKVDLYKLLKESFRENPDYVIVGEVRGEETYVMFQGMASGHPTLSTFHAEDVDSVVDRLRTPPINLPASLVELLDIVITVIKIDKENYIYRRVLKIEEFLSIDERTERINTNPIHIWDSKTDKFNFNLDSRLLDKIAINYGTNAEEIKKEISKRKKFLDNLVKRKIFNFFEVSKEISKYTNK